MERTTGFEPATPTLARLIGDYLTEMYSVLEWKPLASLNLPTDKHGRHLDYTNALECRTVLDTTGLAFDQLAQLA